MFFLTVDLPENSKDKSKKFTLRELFVANGRDGFGRVVLNSFETSIVKLISKLGNCSEVSAIYINSGFELCSVRLFKSVQAYDGKNKKTIEFKNLRTKETIEFGFQNVKDIMDLQKEINTNTTFTNMNIVPRSNNFKASFFDIQCVK